MREQYNAHGVSGYYSKFGTTYRNPHLPCIRRVLLDAKADLLSMCPSPKKVLDLACGSGEGSLALGEVFDTLVDITACDPYTRDSYKKHTGRECLPISFEDVANGAFTDQHFDICVCSFAMHLLGEYDGTLFSTAYQLAMICDTLIILTPHKRPEITPCMGWSLTKEYLKDKVRARVYQTLLR